MHVASSEFRTLRQDGLVIRFALLGPRAYALAEVPSAGSAGTSIEQSCSKPHWGFVIDGDVTFESAGRTQRIAPGSAFHVAAGGPEHRFHAAGAARIAGFEPIDPAIDTTDTALAAQGFEVLSAGALGDATVIPTVAAPQLEFGRIDARAWAMSSLVLSQVRLGPGSGYTSDWCDAPHWGLVTSGRLAIEWEDDIEIVAAGDVYHCPAGPPGHRFEAADPATIIDLTPADVVAGSGRLAGWRRRVLEDAQASALEPIAVAQLG